MIGQRLHEDDLPGHLLAEGGWEHICLPMQFEPGRMKPTSLGWTDPRTQPGELLWPALFSRERIQESVRTMRPHHAAGQLQQRPSSPQGELFKREWFQVVSREELPADLAESRAVRYWDKAGTEGGGAFTAGVLMARHPTGWYVLDVRRGQWGALARESEIKRSAEFDADAWINYSVWQEQEPGSGGKESAENTVRNLAGFAIHTERVTGDKQARWEPWEAQLEAGNVRLVRGVEPGLHRRTLCRSQRQIQRSDRCQRRGLHEAREKTQLLCGHGRLTSRQTRIRRNPIPRETA